LYLANLYAARFRNIAETNLSLKNGINLLYGANGAGKTAVLEAIFMLGRGPLISILSKYPVDSERPLGLGGERGSTG
jgi:recombinational DNA repair ATPase RecF